MSNRERRKYYQQLAIKRLGETRINNNGSKMWIVDYKNATDMIKKNNNYQAKCSMGNGKSKHLGKFTSVEDAFNCYKKNKELIIKEIANQYKNLIPQKVQEAMMNYVVELDD